MAKTIPLSGVPLEESGSATTSNVSEIFGKSETQQEESIAPRLRKSPVEEFPKGPDSSVPLDDTRSDHTIPKAKLPTRAFFKH